MSQIRQRPLRPGRGTTATTALAVVLAAALVAPACGGEDPTARADTAAPPATSLAEAPPTTSVDSVEGPRVYGDVVSRVIPFGLEALSDVGPPGPLYLAYGAGALWVSHHRTHTVSRVDPGTGEIVATIAIDPTPGSTASSEPVASGAATGGGCLVATDDAVWVLDHSGFAWEIDPETNRIAGRVELPGVYAESGIALRDGRLWALGERGPMRIDESSGTAAGPFPAGPGIELAPGVAASPGAVWVGSTAGAIRLDPSTGAVDRAVAVGDGQGASPIGFADDLVWLVGPDGVWAIDPATDEVVRSLDEPAGVDTLRADSATITDEAIWVVAGPEDRGASHPALRQQLVRFDLATGEVASDDLVNAEFGYIMGLTVADGSVWAADFARGNLLELDVDA